MKESILTRLGRRCVDRKRAPCGYRASRCLVAHWKPTAERVPVFGLIDVCPTVEAFGKHEDTVEDLPGTERDIGESVPLNFKPTAERATELGLVDEYAPVASLDETEHRPADADCGRRDIGEAATLQLEPADVSRTVYSGTTAHLTAACEGLARAAGD